jgi:hypothetical protein
MRIGTTQSRIGVCLIGLVVVGGIVVGCGEKPEPPPVAYMGPTLAGDTLGMDRSVATKSGYTLLSEEPSAGLFPAALAVARLVQPERIVRPDNSPGWHVGTIGFEEAITWNSLANTIPSIREVIVMDRQSTVSQTANLEQISSTARRMEARLCLVYGPGSAEADHAGLWGVILDTTAGRKIAVVQAQAGPEDYEPPSPARPEVDQRHRDVNYLAMRKFQEQVRRCVLTLIERDQPSATTQPNPWKAKPSRQEPIYIMPNPTPG